MNLSFQVLIIKFVTPYIWKYFPERKLNSLRYFSTVEKDSACRFMQYVPLMEDPKLKNEVFQHALEEFHHASMFEELVKKINNSYINIEIAPRKFIITEKSTKEELLNAYAYAHVGEDSINKDFWAYNNQKFDPLVRKTFAKISIDEKRHAGSSDHVLMGLCQSERSLYSRVILKAKFKRWYEQYSVTMKSVGEIQLNLMLKLVYFFVGPIALMSLRNRLDLSTEAQLAVFKEQIEDMENTNK